MIRSEYSANPKNCWNEESCSHECHGSQRFFLVGNFIVPPDVDVSTDQTRRREPVTAFGAVESDGKIGVNLGLAGRF